MKIKQTVHLNNEEVTDAISQFLHEKGYKRVKKIRFEVSEEDGFVIGASAEIEFVTEK